MFILLPAFFVVLTFVGPRRLFWSCWAWVYRYPDTHEPSDAADIAGRVLTAALAVAVVIFTIVQVNEENNRDALRPIEFGPALVTASRAGSAGSAV